MAHNHVSSPDLDPKAVETIGSVISPLFCPVVWWIKSQPVLMA
jgi:hypothetical protein